MNRLQFATAGVAAEADPSAGRTSPKSGCDRAPAGRAPVFPVKAVVRGSGEQVFQRLGQSDGTGHLLALLAPRAQVKRE